MKRPEKAKVTKEAVVAALQAGPLKNVEIRRVIFGAGHEERDPSGSSTTEALQVLKRVGQVKVEGGKRSLLRHASCPACHGRGFAASDQ